MMDDSICFEMPVCRFFGLKQAAVATFAATVMLTMLWQAAPAWAQNVQGQVPTQANPGLVTPPDTTEPERQPEPTPPTEERPPEVQIEVPQQPPSVQLDVAKFKADRIVVEGSTLFRPGQFTTITAPYEGKEVTFSDLETIVDKINTMYRDRGYLTSQAYVPPQDVNQGTVVIRVVEGRVGNVCFTGNRYYRSSAILRNLSSRPGALFNIRQLEEDLNRSNRLNNYRLKATLTPGEQTGETDINIDVIEQQPWQISPTFDNQGRPFIGYYRGGLELMNDSLFGYGDRLSAQFRASSHSQQLAGSYFVPLNRRGNELGFSYGYSHVDIDLRIPNQPDIDGFAHSYQLTFTHPFDRDRIWVGDASFIARHVTSTFNDVQDSESDIRSLQFGLNFNKTDRLGRTFARAQTDIGIDWLGANTNFWKAEGFFTRLLNLPLNNLLIIRAYGQITPDALPIAEAFQLGGAYSVRGFTEGLLVGDRGYSFSIEDRFPIPFLRAISPWLADRLQGAVFFDMGQAFIDSSNPRYIYGFSNRSSRTLLIGTGFGLRAQLSQYLQGFVDVGFGLVDARFLEPYANPTARIHFGVRSNLLPKDYKERSTPQRCVKPKAASRTNRTTPPASTPPASPAPSPEQKGLSPLSSKQQPYRTMARAIKTRPVSYQQRVSKAAAKPLADRIR